MMFSRLAVWPLDAPDLVSPVDRADDPAPEAESDAYAESVLGAGDAFLYIEDGTRPSYPFVGRRLLPRLAANFCNVASSSDFLSGARP